MIRVAILVLALSVWAARGQTTNNPAPPRDEALKTKIATQAEETPPEPRQAKPNEIQGKNVTYSGIAVAAIKTDRVLQLFNPAAPSRYGSAEANVVREPGTRKVSGLKIFSIEF